MNQDEINQAEWNNAENWSLFCYHSQRDTRFLVPKRLGFGWTINLRSKRGMLWFWALLLIPAFAGLIIALVLGLEFPRR